MFISGRLVSCIVYLDSLCRRLCLRKGLGQVWARKKNCRAGQTECGLEPFQVI